MVRVVVLLIMWHSMQGMELLFMQATTRMVLRQTNGIIELHFMRDELSTKAWSLAKGVIL